MANIKRYTLWGLLFIVLQLIGQYAQGALTFSFLSKFGLDLGAEELGMYIPWMETLENSLGGTGLLIFGVVTGIIFGVAMLYLMVGSIRNTADMFSKKKDKTVGEYFMSANSVFWPLVLVGIMTTIAIVLGFMLLIIPGILFSVWFMYATYEVIFKQKRGVEAMKSSKALITGRFWAVMWRLAVVYVVIMIFSIIAAMAFSAIDAMAVAALGEEVIWLSLLIFSIPNLVIVPFSIAIQYVLYSSLHESKGDTTKTVQPEDLASAV